VISLVYLFILSSYHIYQPRRYRARHTTFLVAFALLFWYVLDHIETEYITKKEQRRYRIGASINDKPINQIRIRYPFHRFYSYLALSVNSTYKFSKRNEPGWYRIAAGGV